MTPPLMERIPLPTPCSELPAAQGHTLLGSNALGGEMDQAALLTLDLPNRPEAAGTARTAVRTLNESLHLLGEEPLHDLQLLVTELVTNAVRHGSPGGGIVVAFRVDRRTLRVDVRDHGAGFDPALVRDPSPGSRAGRGLAIVAALAHRWGVERAAGTTVWFELHRPATLLA